MTTAEDIPPEALAMLERLWSIDQPLTFQLRPSDAWIVLAIIQFASRHPEITPTQLNLMQQFGRQLQQAITDIEPAADQYLEMGWDPAHDVPRGDPDDDPGQRVGAF